jgi:hypothetical protein
LEVENLEENFDLGSISYNATIDINNVFVSLYLYDLVAEQLVTGQKTPWLWCVCEHKNTDQGKLAASIDEWRRISS